MVYRRITLAAAILVGLLAGAGMVAAPAHADRTWTKNGCTMRAVKPYIYWSGNTKNFVSRTTMSCQYAQPGIKVRARLMQYRGLSNWSQKKSNELRAANATTANVAAIWPCSGGNQLYQTWSNAWWGLNDEYAYAPDPKMGEDSRLTC